MDDRIYHIRQQLWEGASEEERYVLEMDEQIRRLEAQILDLSQILDDNSRMILESYLDCKAELELLTTQQAFKRGKALGIQIGQSLERGMR